MAVGRRKGQEPEQADWREYRRVFGKSGQAECQPRGKPKRGEGRIAAPRPEQDFGGDPDGGA